MDTPCKLWEGAKTKDGYGSKKVNKVVCYVHRLEWEKHNGPIPRGLVIRHKCDIRHCYEITHLELGTQKQNIADSIKRGRHSSLHQKPRRS